MRQQRTVNDIGKDRETKLQKAPKYRDEDVPEYDTSYGKRVNSYCGVDW